MPVNSAEETLLSGLVLNVRQCYSPEGWGCIAALRCMQSNQTVVPTETREVIQHQKLHSAICNNTFYDPYEEDQITDKQIKSGKKVDENIVVLRAYPADMVDWYRSHSFEELTGLWVSLMGNLIVNEEYDRDCVLRDSPGILRNRVKDWVQNAQVDSDWKEWRERFPSWLMDYYSHWLFPPGKCYKWIVRPDDLERREDDDLVNRCEADKSAFDIFKGYQNGDCWPKFPVNPPEFTASGFVYLISDGLFTKIGATTKDPYARLGELQTGNPRPLAILKIISAENLLEKERALHRRFAEQRATGEWFRLSPADIDSIE